MFDLIIFFLVFSRKVKLSLDLFLVDILWAFDVGAAFWFQQSIGIDLLRLSCSQTRRFERKWFS